MYKFLAVFIGGGFGAMLRYFAGSFVFARCQSCFPVSTLAVNVLGSLILGFSFVFFVEHTNFAPEAKLFLTVGFCGGLTTFSTFALDIWNLFLDGEILNGTLYLLLNIILSVAAVAVGVVLAKQFS